jgi:serine/threonine protein kinase
MSRSTTEHRLLSNRYRIEDPLGVGGMARVFRGTDLVLGRTVAIKVLAEHLARDPRSVERFRREAQAAAGLSHPGIVSVYDTGSDGDDHYIVMEHISGRTLADLEEEAGRFHPERAAEIAEAVAFALAHAHGKGIVHRDIKPGNIMITPSGEVKVMDFGIARALGGQSFTQTATVLGTATYFSPEQAMGERVDARSDLYALGVVLYEMLAGRAPFAGDSPVSVAYQHVRQEPEPPSRLNPDVDRALEAIVLKAMAKDREVRYQSAEEMQRDLGRLRGPAAPAGVAVGSADRTIEQPPVERTAVLPPVPPSRRATRQPRRAPWLIALLALLAMALVGGLILASGSRTPSDRSNATPSSSPSPAERPSGTTVASPTPVQPTTIEVSVAQLEAILNQGLSQGELTERAAKEIEKDLEESLREFPNGSLDKALEKLDKAEGKVGEFEGKGEITGQRADLIRGGITDLAAAMRAAPPSGGGDGDDEGD